MIVGFLGLLVPVKSAVFGLSSIDKGLAGSAIFLPRSVRLLSTYGCLADSVISGLCHQNEL